MKRATVGNIYSLIWSIAARTIWGVGAISFEFTWHFIKMSEITDIRVVCTRRTIQVFFFRVLLLRSWRLFLLSLVQLIDPINCSEYLHTIDCPRVWKRHVSLRAKFVLLEHIGWFFDGEQNKRIVCTESCAESYQVNHNQLHVVSRSVFEGSGNNLRCFSVFQSIHILPIYFENCLADLEASRFMSWSSRLKWLKL